MRATSEASRRTLQGAQDVMQTTSAYLAESTEANRKPFQAYAQGAYAQGVEAPASRLPDCHPVGSLCRSASACSLKARA